MGLGMGGAGVTGICMGNTVIQPKFIQPIYNGYKEVCIHPALCSILVSDAWF